MKIISWNVNGLRAVYRRGFLGWLRKESPDILCLQEVKADQNQLPWDLTFVADYQFYLNSAQKSGYSGVAVYSRIKPKKIEGKIGLGRFDQEGRVLILYFDQFILFNLYLPHGGRQKENLAYKLEAYSFLLKRISSFSQPLILAGDFNVAHQEIDLVRPKENQNNIMFTPEEREQIDRLIDLGLIDSFRHLYPDKTGVYSWWPYGFDARERNLGWRIDYIFISGSLSSKLRAAFIQKEVDFSDHAPIGIEIKGI